MIGGTGQMRSLDFPGAPPVPHADAPPASLIERWLPELLAEHQSVARAVAAELEAKESFEAALPPRGSYLGAGSDWAAVVAADLAAVRRRRKPEQLALLIADTGHPVRQVA